MSSISFVVNRVSKIKVTCTKPHGEGRCGGVFEGTIEDFCALQYGKKCPNCRTDFSTGRKMYVDADQIKGIGNFLRSIKGTKDFEVEFIIELEEKTDV